jgi:hypothetical protein
MLGFGHGPTKASTRQSAVRSIVEEWCVLRKRALLCPMDALSAGAAIAAGFVDIR